MTNRADEIKKAKMQIKEGKLALKEIRNSRKQEWNNDALSKFLKRATTFNIEEHQKKKIKAEKVIDNALMKVCKIIPDKNERDTFLSSYGN